MKLVGAHVSVEQGVSNAPLNARSIGARSFALFTRNPSRWTSKAIPDAEAERFKANCAECGYDRDAFLDEMRRCEQLGLTMLNFHPGSHLRLMDPDRCLDLIAESLNVILDKTAGVKAVIENTAGQGSNLGYTFAQIARIIDRVEDKSRVGVCIDTCHAHSAGYDMTTPEAYERTWREFEDVIGLQYFSGMHLNDTLKAIGSHVDRHASIGTGLLDKDFWIRLMNDPRMEGIPLILETPDDTIWAEEIKFLTGLEKD